VWQIRTGEDLGRAMAGVREARNLTQEQLAELVGINRAYLAAIEAGASVQMLVRTLRALRRMGAEVTITITVAPEPDPDD